VAYSWTIVRDEHLADDVFQDVSVLALRKREEIRDERHFLRWLRVTARYRSLQLLEKRKAAPRSIGTDVLDALENHWEDCDELETSEVKDALHRCVAKLSPYGRRLVALRYGEGLTGAALAAALSRKLRTVYVAVSRVNQTLARCVEKTLSEESA